MAQVKPTIRDVLLALSDSGLLPFCDDVAGGLDRYGKGKVTGKADIGVLLWLHQHSQFLTGPWHVLHKELGKPRAEFRSLRGVFFPDRSLQFVINTQTGQFHADLDLYNPYEDVVGAFGHIFGEVMLNRFRRWFGKEEKHA